MFFKYKVDQYRNFAEVLIQNSWYASKILIVIIQKYFLHSFLYAYLSTGCCCWTCVRVRLYNPRNLGMNYLMNLGPWVRYNMQEINKAPDY